MLAKKLFIAVILSFIKICSPLIMVSMQTSQGAYKIRGLHYLVTTAFSKAECILIKLRSIDKGISTPKYQVFFGKLKLLLSTLLHRPLYITYPLTCIPNTPCAVCLYMISEFILEMLSGIVFQQTK